MKKKLNTENKKIKALLDSIKIKIQTTQEIPQGLTMRAILENSNYFCAFQITSQLAFTALGGEISILRYKQRHLFTEFHLA